MNTTFIPAKIAKRSLLKRGLLSCGIASSALYAAMLILVPMQWDDYSSASQTVSERSAIDAPTRALWVLPGMAYTLLMVMFGFGIYKSVEENRYLKIVGTVIIIYGLIGIFWSPMHLREMLAVNRPILTDTLHIVWTIATVLLMLLAIWFG
jgi:hypothetical protein